VESAEADEILQRKKQDKQTIECRHVRLEKIINEGVASDIPKIHEQSNTGRKASARRSF
jgi:hypothetical protein